MAFCHPTRLTIVRARWWRPVRPSMRQSIWPSMAHLTVLVYCKHLHHCTIRFHASTLWQKQDKVHEAHTTPHGAEYVWTRSRLVCDWRGRPSPRPQQVFRIRLLLLLLKWALKRGALVVSHAPVDSDETILAHDSFWVDLKSWEFSSLTRDGEMIVIIFP